MQKYGIILEINPLHNGHLYFLNKVRKLAQNKPIIAIISGNYVQRGEVSTLDKFSKANLLIDYGVNLVVELPFVFTNQGAEYFADHAINILNDLGITDLIFGSETNDLNYLKEQSASLVNNSFKVGINNNLKTLKSNDILAVSYLKSIKKINPYIKAHPIKRIANHYNDLTTNDSSIASATAIRNKFDNNQDIDNYLPVDVLKSMKIIDNKLLFNLFTNNLNYAIDHNINIFLSEDCQLLFKLQKFIEQADSIEELVKLAKDKNNSQYKLKRIILNTILLITQYDIQIIMKENRYIRILAINNKDTYLLKNIEKKYYKSQVNNKLHISKIELRATKLYDLVTNQKTIKLEYQKKVIKKEKA